MRKSVASLLLAAFLICGCSDEYRSEDYAAGPNGEPPRALERYQVYTTKFVAEQKNYVLALGRIHAFLIANDFLTLYPACFDDVLDIRVTAIVKKHKERFPCVALQAAKGLPTKVYLNVTIDDVFFNQLDGNDRLIYTVSMFGLPDLVNAFESDVEPALRTLYAGPSDATKPVSPDKSPERTLER